jgi:hypothetical protein
MSPMISPGVRATAALGGAGVAAAGSAGRARGTAAAAVAPSLAGTGFADAVAALNIGAGCEPDCMNSTLTRIAPVAKAMSRTPAASFAPHPSTRNTGSR